MGSLRPLVAQGSGRVADGEGDTMATRGFKEHMSAFQERMFLTPPRPEDRLKPWTTADIAKFAGANPKAAADMQTLRSAGLVSGLGGLLGGGAGAAFFFSRPGTINGKLFSAALGFAGNGLVGYLLTTNITCFTHGTYKIDSKATNDAWQTWWRANGGAGGKMYQY